MTDSVCPYEFFEEVILSGGVRWIKFRARGSQPSLITVEEAVVIGREWVERYGETQNENCRVGDRGCSDHSLSLCGADAGVD